MTEHDYIKMIISKYEGKKSSVLLQLSKSILQKLIQLIFLLIIMLFISLPIFFFLLLRKVFKGIPIFHIQEVISYKSKIVKVPIFNIKGHLLKKMSLIYQIAAGKVNFIGSSFLPSDYLQYDYTKLIFAHSHPGIFNLWFIRESTKIAHEGLLKTELEYLATRSIKRDLSIILKTFPALLYRSETKNYHPKLNIFDLEFDNVSMQDALSLLKMSIEEDKKRKFFFVNPDCMNKLYSNEDYFSILTRGDFIFPDGIGISIACNILKTPLLENVNGTDMLPYLCEMSEKEDYSIFLFGAKPGIAKKMKKKLEEKFPNLKIVGVRDGYFDWTNDSLSIVEEINTSKANILLVAFGVPLQEKWIDKYYHLLQPQVLMGVGGLFDFYSGEMKRAPKWMREIGMEWLFRLLKEPKRMWRRYIIGNPLFLYRVFKWKKNKNR